VISSVESKNINMFSILSHETKLGMAWV